MRATRVEMATEMSEAHEESSNDQNTCTDNDNDNDEQQEETVDNTVSDEQTSISDTISSGIVTRSVATGQIVSDATPSNTGTPPTISTARMGGLMDRVTALEERLVGNENRQSNNSPNHDYTSLEQRVSAMEAAMETGQHVDNLPERRQDPPNTPC
ncbi:hypothetical protein E2C01_036134 [Portunus trituberculatus]|uniref:Uncharacterized protein n=1 Tax=Portunus trituberculatus TaxID=210409 RepID=A0A5B7F7W4_PORTR|nr:hypothetical protein [Portunus trituberculatus]